MSALIRATKPLDFDGLYRQHAPTVYRYAYAVLGNQADAEDVTQQTFLNAYRAIAQGTKPRKAENWLIRIAHNEVRRHFRKNGGAHEVEFDDQIGDGGLEPVDPGLADVLRALRKLPPSQRAALVLREFEGRSYAEIAETMEVTQSALEALLFRARRSLAAELEEALTCTEAEQAISRRLDKRLKRRESRRLKEHLHECGRCVSFATLQKRQRSALKALSIMPIPASLFLFRGEHAAAFGGGAAAAAGTGAGVTVVAKAAAVAAAVAVTGGVGYGVTTERGDAPKPASKFAQAAPAADGRPAVRRPAQSVASVASVTERAEPAPGKSLVKRVKLKLRPFRPPHAKPKTEAKTPGQARGHEKVVKPAKPAGDRAQRKDQPVRPARRTAVTPRTKRAKPERRRTPRQPVPGRAREKANPPKAEQPLPPPPIPAEPPPKKPKP